MIRLLLYPLSLIYGFITWLRNRFFDLGLLKESRYATPMITVGNIRVGGTGKSPMVEYLVRLLGDKFHVSILSRGYGRATKGLLEAEWPALASQIGDEPAQFKNKFQNLNIVVSEDRRKGIEYISGKVNSAAEQVIILDDAFQHRKIKAGLNLVLMEFGDVFTKKILLPAGNYREKISAFKRADAIVITKTIAKPNEKDVLKIRQKLKLRQSMPLFFSSIVYQKPLSFHDSSLQLIEPNEGLRTIILLTGIANAKPLLEYLSSDARNTVLHQAYPDHHVFSIDEIKKYTQAYQKAPGRFKIMLTTEKDAQRLKNPEFESELANFPLYYIPIQNEIWNYGEETFDSFITHYVRTALSDR